MSEVWSHFVSYFNSFYYMVRVSVLSGGRIPQRLHAAQVPDDVEDVAVSLGNESKAVGFLQMDSCNYKSYSSVFLLDFRDVLEHNQVQMNNYALERISYLR